MLNSKVETERRNPHSDRIDTLSTMEILRVINDEDNRLAQSFTISQDGETIHESGRIDPGQEVTSCAAEGAVAGAALITVQGLEQ